MSAGLIGAICGFLLGGISLGLSRALAARVELPETRRALAVSGIVQMIFFPVAGWFIAPLLFGD